MSSNDRYVVNRPGGWAVRAGGASRASSVQHRAPWPTMNSRRWIRIQRVRLAVTNGRACNAKEYCFARVDA